jgi:phosphoribosylcarboxyaminoimidazole (NCAIR) mutase
VRILASGDDALTAKLTEFAAGLEAMVAEKNAHLADGS